MLFRSLFFFFVALFALTFTTSEARAYPWMIRHEYTSCNACHADPSGGSLLTEYGRAQGVTLLASKWSDKEDEDPGKIGGFLFGAVKMPESLLMGFDARGLLLHTRAGGASDTRFVHMQADLQAQVTIADRFRVNGSIGYIHQGAAAASITKNADHRLVSRSHWLGVDVGEDKNWLIRAGRMNLPFGIRSIEHTMWVRRDTQTDINAAQQHGASVAYNSEKIRAEFMGILGNFQLSPDAYRERGYSAYFEYVPAEKLAVGVSSLLTHAGQAISSPANPVWRHAHGIFGRYSPTKMLVLSAEADFLLTSVLTEKKRLGMAGMLSADIEPWQGLHFLATFETKNTAFGTDGQSLGLWGGAQWFVLPHLDLRVDAVYRNESVATTRNTSFALLTQLHAYL